MPCVGLIIATYVIVLLDIQQIGAFFEGATAFIQPSDSAGLALEHQEDGPGSMPLSSARCPKRLILSRFGPLAEQTAGAKLGLSYE
jgi:hypothetical protein